jgi:hypothetical protein
MPSRTTAEQVNSDLDAILYEVKDCQVNPRQPPSLEQKSRSAAAQSALDGYIAAIESKFGSASAEADEVRRIANQYRYVK